MSNIFGLSHKDTRCVVVRSCFKFVTSLIRIRLKRQAIWRKFVIFLGSSWKLLGE